ncbi:pheromone alpha factor receptor [Cytospora paraplurivora]|uniref:Pheromone alpha factor receptor n=1 Tax=Cytospora paraplurivora TaxID=2898453 RepID=A0AAN9UE39_9PEZI
MPGIKTSVLNEPTKLPQHAPSRPFIQILHVYLFLQPSQLILACLPPAVPSRFRKYWILFNMSDTDGNPMAIPLADLLGQTINLTMPDGSQMPVPLSAVDQTQRYIIGTTIGYSVELGASLVMLAVILAMTPKKKFWRASTFVNVFSLGNNIIRTVLLALYFNSSWTQFYVLYSGDTRAVTPGDFRNSVASVVVSIPQNLLMMAALMLQAWVMVKLWPDLYKLGILAFSCILTLTEVGFMLASQIYQIRSLYPGYDARSYLTNIMWIRYAWLALEVSAVCWFAFMFILKLATHMWTNRSFLPSAKGLAAMDVLVMTNGVLMLIPVIFAGLQYSNKLNFEPGSMLYTAVIIVLPLGTLVAQRIADPGAFNSDLSAGSTRIGLAPDRYASGKKPLLPSWSQSNNSSAVFPGGSSSRGAVGKTGIISTVSSMRHHNEGGEPMGPMDLELARIDGDIEMGKVRVNRDIQRSEEVI